jgi:hypothetical protein
VLSHRYYVLFLDGEGDLNVLPHAETTLDTPPVPADESLLPTYMAKAVRVPAAAQHTIFAAKTTRSLLWVYLRANEQHPTIILVCFVR